MITFMKYQYSWSSQKNQTIESSKLFFNRDSYDKGDVNVFPIY